MFDAEKYFGEPAYDGEVPPEISEEQERQGVDWNAWGAVAPIREQKCGDCYSFAAISALESAYWQKTLRMVHQSEQKVVDCSSQYNYGYGCNGGCQFCAYDAMKEWSSVTRDSYPYANGVQQGCDPNRGSAVTKTKGHTRVAVGENNLKRALVWRPVAVAVDASSEF
jgi:C1A family cysteine protease